ncbi:Secretoglobin family 1D member, partial [Eschrichtius robustus]|uniref:secretoglobin family 1D member-like n=1 Tax=Eschrichtius robustus TaxID=9764 RepID=UPI000C36F3ED|nr:Secretoglobin family 1D member [Eschrichtius robustus]
MRLSLPVLLVTLALCCYEGNAFVCSSLIDDLTGFFWKPDEVYKAKLQKYNAPPEAVEAKMEVKKCVNQFSFVNKLLLTKTLGKVLVNCGFTDVKCFLSFVLG